MSEFATPDDRVLSRLLFFSDAVFAIVLTLLVLELRVPAAHGAQAMAQALIALAPHFIAFGASFALTTIFWAAHLAIMRRLQHFDWPVVWANALLLLVIALMPFASALLGEGTAFAVSWQVYCVVLIAASLAQTLLVLVVMRDGGRLIGGASLREILWRTLRALSPGIAFAAGLVLVIRGQYALSAVCGLLIPVILVVSNVLFGPRRSRPAEPEPAA